MFDNKICSRASDEHLYGHWTCHIRLPHISTNTFLEGHIFNIVSSHFCRDAIITCIVNTLTCLLAGVLVFSILGYMAHVQETTIHDVVNSGPGLVFLTYPDLVLNLPGSVLWAVIFFIMLLVLGVDSEFCNVEALVTGIVDNWPHLLMKVP